MDRINGAGHVGRRFVAEDANTNRPPTEITDVFLNSLQEEVAGFVESAGLVLDAENNSQLRQAADVLYMPKNMDFGTLP